MGTVSAVFVERRIVATEGVCGRDERFGSVTRRKIMEQSDNLKYRKLPLRGGSGTMPALGFGTLIPDATETKNATVTALETGFRHLDCAERYRNEEQVGEAIREAVQAGSLTRTGLVRHDKAVEQQSSPGARPAGIRGEP